MFCQKLAVKCSYQASIGGMKLSLVKLQAKDGQEQKIRAEKLSENWQYSNRILHYQDLLYIPEIIKTKPISRYYNNPLVGYFGIKKIRKLVTRKYY